ncbi:MAG: carboxylesterase family protein, partial [Ilumatobacteraceae bacterium]
APVVDGGLVPRRAIDAVVAGSSDGVDAVIATCADEYRVFIWGLPEPLRSMVPPPDPTAYFRTTERDPATVVAAYQSNRPGAGQLDVAAAIAGDAVFGIPAVRLLEAKAGRGDRVWAHEMAWPTPVLDGSLGACHGLDLPFLFDDLGHPGFVGPEPPQAVADDLHGLCVRFASGGDPNGGRLPPWPVYDSASRSVMRLHETSGVVHDPRAAERIVWEGTW